MNNDSQPLEQITASVTPLAADVMTAAAGGLLSGIRESSADVWGAIIGDPLKIWRAGRLIDGLEGVARKISSKGIELKDAKALPYGDMLVLFDGISKEDNETLSDMWQRLIAEAMTDNGEPSISTRSVAAILNQLSPETAKIIELLAKEAKLNNINTEISKKINSQMFIADKTEDEYELEKKSLKLRAEGIRSNIIEELKNISQGGQRVNAQLEIAKGELLRLSLIDRKHVHVSFEMEPFSRGYQINPDGLDTVLAAMQEKFEELVSTRTNHSQTPFINHPPYNLSMNFQLNMAGKAVAEKLDLL